MKLTALIKELQYQLDTHGDVEVCIHEARPEGITAYDTIFVVPEEVTFVNSADAEPGVGDGSINIMLRTWPY